MTRHPAHDIYTYLGAHPAEQGFTFRVWAPNARAVALSLIHISEPTRPY